ncbi:hypothetical protein [Methanobrevibacter sp.]
MASKTCKKCGNKVNVNHTYCEICGSSEFVKPAEVIVQNTEKPSIVHRLFYWNYDGYYVLSKSKLLGIFTFLLILLTAAPSPVFALIVVGLIIGTIVFLIGFILHTFLSHPSKAKLTHNDYGFINDLVHLLFFWQNKNTGEFVKSKTKIISFVLFILLTVLGFAFHPPSALAAVLLGLLFYIPSFLIGSAVHKLTNPNPVNPKKQVSKPKEIPKSKPVIESFESDAIDEYKRYEIEVLELQKQYSMKEQHTRDLIEKRFAPPQLTYTRFISVVDKSTDLFNKQADSTLTMIRLGNEYSAKVENEIKTRIDILKNITDKLDDLTNELVLSMDDSNDEEIHNLFDDMSDLIKSVKDY